MSLTVGKCNEEFEKVMHPYDLRSLFRTIETLRSAAPGDDDDGDGDDDDLGDDDDKGGSGGTGTGEEDAKKGIDDPDKKRLSDEAGKHRRLRREAEERAAKAEAALKEIEDKDKSESERLKSELEAVTARAEASEAKVAEWGKRIAIVQACEGKGVSDLTLLEFYLDKEGKLEEYLDEDGDPLDISDTVDAIIKKHPNLVATSGEGDDDEDEPIASGKRTDGKRKKDDGKGKDFATLAQRFPALQRR